jgi:hypothetical protein
MSDEAERSPRFAMTVETRTVEPGLLDALMPLGRHRGHRDHSQDEISDGNSAPGNVVKGK